MTHIFSDEEYQEYLNLKNTVKEQEHWINDVKENAKQYMKHAKGKIAITDKIFNHTEDLICWHEEDEIEGYCNMCPIGWIFPECPFGRTMSYSK
jgi:hypothetical protein